MKFTTELDKGYLPMIVKLREFAKDAASQGARPLGIMVERNGGYNSVYRMNIYADEGRDAESYPVVERVVKTLLWVAGGYKIYIEGSRYIAKRLAAAYSKGGEREFDADFMAGVYERPFEVVFTEKLPEEKKYSAKIGGNLDGCRIGFDAGGSDRKVSAVVDGVPVYSEEVVWQPKTQSDPEYHYREIKKAFETAASKMPRVDAIGVSSAGVYIDNKIMVASLFIKVPKDEFDRKVKTMYIDIAREFGCPLEVANDGDVTSLAGAMELGDNGILGIAMGTSEAGGYINTQGGLNGWLSELAFVPVDFNPKAAVDEWSGDAGCGVKYFSQDAVIKLAENGGMKFDKGLTPAEKLKKVQALFEGDDGLARRIFRDIGVYLGYTIPYYREFYDIKHVLLLGRVTSGKGGDIILSTARKVLEEEFPEYASIDIRMPDESNRRVGQSIAAASLPKIG